VIKSKVRCNLSDFTSISIVDLLRSG
jgi:hypothetical protein